MEDFNKIVKAGITVEIVNLSRATYENAEAFKNIINNDIAKGVRRLVIDLSHCEFMDSTFIGVLVVALKNITETGGNLRIVKPSSTAHSILETTDALRIFSLYNTIEEAIKTFIH